ncbi:MAG: glycosyltransferase [Planctomycetes bacterium]|nr:glycosyltransferase [Planctomycetota bacterium]
MVASSQQWEVRVVIPALNEEPSLGKVLRALPDDQVSSIHVADNGSTDRTAEVAAGQGARVVHESRKGYGSACLAALGDVRSVIEDPEKEIVVFLDGDFSDDPSCLPLLIEPLIQGEADLVLGNRAHHGITQGALTLQQRFGNRLATLLIRLIHGVRYQDLGPFRALRWETLEQMKMQDPDFGWTVEMQIKAARMNLRVREIDLPYRPRIGTSKISGTLKGSFQAGVKIMSWVFRDLWAGPRNQS